MKITDGKKTVEIEIKRWNGNGYDPDWSQDYFNAGTLCYDEGTDTYKVDDVDYCIDMAKGTDEEGACYNDDNMCVFVTEM